ncbi:hypothetical protein J4E81_004710 [Alternaria sp. BMP 2799]|nr:hypothetical protein J4E81_004710 [Alternaria sp. BMP 2799]
MEKPKETDTERIEKAITLNETIDTALDKRLNRKFDLRILPWLFGIWLFSFIDRSNIGNARIAGLSDELSITTGTRFNIALLVFYIPYILVDVPSNLLVKRLRAGIYLPALITAWGLVFEGAITVVFGIVCFFFMPDTPAAAGFLSDEEKEWALRRMRLDAGGSTEVDVDDEKFSWYWVKMALKAPQTYLSAFIWFFLLVPLYSFSLFLPSIIAGMGYQSTTAQLFTVPPNMAAFITVIGTAYASDKLKNRGYFIIGGCVIGICGYVMLIVATTNAVRYAGTFLVAIGVFQGSPMLMVSFACDTK